MQTPANSLSYLKMLKKWDVAKTAVVAAMMEAHVSILHFQSLDKHFKSKSCLGNRDQTGKHPNSCVGAWLHLQLLQDSWVLGCGAATTQRADGAYNLHSPSAEMLAQDVAGRHSRKLNCLDLPPEVLVLLIQLPYQGKKWKASQQDCPLHVSRDAGLLTAAQGMHVVLLGRMGVDHPLGKGIKNFGEAVPRWDT